MSTNSLASSPGRIALTVEEQLAVRELIQRVRAERAAEVFGISRNAAIQAAAGLRILRGTRAMILAGLATLKVDA